MNTKNFIVGGGIVAAIIVGGLLLIPNGVDWDLHIVFFDVGQADAIAIVSKNGDACVIDAGKTNDHGKLIARFLTDTSFNKVDEINHVKLAFATHFDLDHIGGFDALSDAGISFGSIYDQGASSYRDGKLNYSNYLEVTGDMNNNMIEDAGEQNYVRKQAKVGVQWKLGDAKIKCVSARGDTKGNSHDVDIDPLNDNHDENAGSIALLITLGNFEFYTAGDQTSNDWKSNEKDTEIGVVKSGVLGAETDIDVLKVSHHGSDTSTGKEFIQALHPEVAIICSEYTKDKLPKMVSIKQLVDDSAFVYITGNGIHEDSISFAHAKTPEDDGFFPDTSRVRNDAGEIHIFVYADGDSFRVHYKNRFEYYSAVDAHNIRH